MHITQSSFTKWYFLFEAYNPLKIYPDRSQILIFGPPVERAITYFPGHGDGILGIVHALLEGESGGLTVRSDDVTPVQGAGLQGLYQLEDGEAGPDLLVLEVSDGEVALGGLQPLVGPLDNL